tara:strand:+ start:788 stop:1267 length:480 start_codon:yes stop_codon:yes gene_type:complete
MNGDRYEKFSELPVTKETNPKDAIGIKKPRAYSAVPQNVVREISVGMMEGARKYGRHNYRVAGVRASVYFDATVGHLNDWWEGEDVDPDSGLSHVTKALCSLVVLRDTMMNDMMTDDRPPPSNVEDTRNKLQQVVDDVWERHPDSVPAYTHEHTELHKV